MRIGTLLSLIVLLAAGFCRADAIHFEQIPADATSYFHFDLDRWIASRVMVQSGLAANLSNQLKTMGDGTVGSITIYTLGAGEDQKMVLMAQGNFGPDLPHRIKTAAAGLKDSVPFSLAGKDVYYSSNRFISERKFSPPGHARKRNPIHRRHRPDLVSPWGSAAKRTLGDGHPLVHPTSRQLGRIWSSQPQICPRWPKRWMFWPVTNPRWRAVIRMD